jgi:DedD protein
MSWPLARPNQIKPMPDSQDAIVVKKRARRRLIGAVALVLFVVIVLPMVLDKEPKPLQNELSVQIPRQDASAFKSGVLPPAPVKVEEPAGPAKAEPSQVAPAAVSEPKSAVKAQEAEAPKAAAVMPQAPAKAAPKPEPKPAASPVPPAEAKRAQAALEDATWVVPIGAFSNTENVRQLQAKLSAAGVKSITEVLKTADGEKIRVRGGPFKTKAEAEKAREAIKAIGVNAGAVTSR